MRFSGNQGLLDQIAALGVDLSKTSSAVGGNPDAHFTIMGQSAGAMSSHVLTFSPLATPMIHQAILQSGSIACFPSPMVFTKAQAQAVTDKFYELCGVSSIEELRRLPAEDLLDKSDELMALYPSLPFRPVVDGHVLPDTPDVLTKEGGMAHIPYLMGVTKDDLFIPEGASHREGGFFTVPPFLLQMPAGNRISRYISMNSAMICRVVMTVLSTLRTVVHLRNSEPLLAAG